MLFQRTRAGGRPPKVLVVQHVTIVVRLGEALRDCEAFLRSHLAAGCETEVGLTLRK